LDINLLAQLLINYIFKLKIVKVNIQPSRPAI